MIRVLLADDHVLLRGGVAAVLSSDPGIEVVGEVDSGPAAVEAAGRLSPDIVLMDVQMPGGDGIAATSEVLRTAPDTRVIVLTMFDLDEYVLGALRAGASGFLIKTMAPKDLIAAVHACAAGEASFGPSVIERLVNSYLSSTPPPLPPGLDALTPREHEVLREMATGMSNAEIGAALFMAETTVKTHVARILAKLGVRDRLRAVVIAHRAGL
jgi:DNA-binding NarL/FixJ family response regulator